MKITVPDAPNMGVISSMMEQQKRTMDDLFKSIDESLARINDEKIIEKLKNIDNLDKVSTEELMKMAVQTKSKNAQDMIKMLIGEKEDKVNFGRKLSLVAANRNSGLAQIAARGREARKTASARGGIQAGIAGLRHRLRMDEIGAKNSFELKLQNLKSSMLDKRHKQKLEEIKADDGKVSKIIHKSAGKTTVQKVKKKGLFDY